MVSQDQTTPSLERTPLAPFASSQPHGLSVLLQFRNQSIAVLHNICVLLVLVVRSVRLDDAIDPVDGACNPVAGNEFGKIPVAVSQCNLTVNNSMVDLPIQVVDGDAEVAGHAVQANNAITLKQLLVRAKSHLAHKPRAVLVQVAVLV